MTKAFQFLALLAFLTAVPASAAHYSDLAYSLTVNDQRGFSAPGDAGRVSDSVLVFVYDAGTKTLSTIYADKNRTAKANPISRAQFATDKSIKFYAPKSSYDLFIAHSDGSIASYKGATTNTHRIQFNRTDVSRVLIAPFAASNAVETDTGLDFPQDAVVTDMRVQVVAAESGKTINVGLLSTGTGGNASGFINGLSLTSAGYLTPATVTVGGSETYLSAVQYGSLLGNFAVGANTAGRTGAFYLFGYTVTGANTTRLSYTTSSGSSAAAGYIYAFFRLLR